MGWPGSPYRTDENRVPIMFFGAGVRAGPLPATTSVDQIAPTIASLIDYDRPHPEVRSGVALAGAVNEGDMPRLVVEISWSGVGSDAFTKNGTPWVDRRIEGADDVASTFRATTGSLPVDPAAVLTTIGTGGLPSQHGITGTLLRGLNGSAVRAWSREAPISIIGTLADDWDHATRQRARIGLVAPDPTDRGIIGGTWYLDRDQDDMVLSVSDPATAVRGLLRSGYGTDTITDILAVVLDGPPERMDRATGQIVASVEQAVPDSTFVLTATGPTFSRTTQGTRAIELIQRLNSALGAPVIATATPGGLFLDPVTMAASDVTSDDVVRQMDALTGGDGHPLFADAYPGFAVSFSRYC